MIMAFPLTQRVNIMMVIYMMKKNIHGFGVQRKQQRRLIITGTLVTGTL